MTLQLGRAALMDVPTILIAIVTAILLFRLQVNPTGLVLGGALIGLGLSFIPR